MKRQVLLDTQAFVLLGSSQADLPRKAREAFLDEKNELFISIASLWEITIKIGLGKLKLPVSLKEALERATRDAGIRVLPIELGHLLVLEKLAGHHRDPFDRLIASQALSTQMPLVSGDKIFDRYKVTRIW